MEKEIFNGFDLNSFWKKSDYALEQYVEAFPDDEMIASIEQELGYKLPASYIKLMKTQNGGFPKNVCYPTADITGVEGDYIDIEGFLSIGRTKSHSLCGGYGSRFWIDEWGYPDDGVYICDCPSGGHEMILLDYTNSGSSGEPEVVHVDEEDDFKKTFLAKDFETFARGLVHEEVYDTSEQDLTDALQTIRKGQFSDTLQEYFQKDRSVDFEHVLRNLFTKLTKAKGYFALHGDPLSHLAYDIQFYLLTANQKVSSWDEFIERYPKMVAFGNNDISTGGFAKGFLQDWFNERLLNKAITKGLWSGYRFSEKYRKELLQQVKEYEQNIS